MRKIIRVVAAKGGLGNQMFQYAVYRELEKMGFDCYFDITPYKKNDFHYGYEIPNVFDLPPVHYGGFEKINPLTKVPKIFGFVNHRIIKDRHLLIDQHDFQHGKIMFESNIDLNLDGYWQSEKYFSDVKDQIRKEFKFKDLDDRNLEYVKRLEKVQSVSIHVRRGDYLNNPLFPEGCTTEYYRKAIQHFQKKLSSPTFIVFSEDIAWCKDDFSRYGEAFEYVNWNKGSKSYQDMFLMTSCKHNIIANSSFSWWGAWLNPNEEKEIIAPERWSFDKNKPFNDIIPTTWIRKSSM